MKFHIHVCNIIRLAGILTALSWPEYVQADWGVEGGPFIPAEDLSRWFMQGLTAVGEKGTQKGHPKGRPMAGGSRTTSSHSPFPHPLRLAGSPPLHYCWAPCHCANSQVLLLTQKTKKAISWFFPFLLAFPFPLLPRCLPDLSLTAYTLGHLGTPYTDILSLL